MEVNSMLGGLGVFAAFGCGSAVAVVAVPWGRTRASSLGVEGARPGRVAWRLRNGVGWAKPAARALLRRPRMLDLARESAWVARAHGFQTGEEALTSLFMVFLAVLTLVVSVATASPVCGIAVAACLCAALAAWLNAARDKRRESMREAVPDALQSMGVCFQSGLSLLQTFQQVSRETSGPLKALFERSAHRMETGCSAQEALDALRRGSTVPELSFVAVALDVQHQAGGSMRQVLDAARATVEGELELRRSLRVQTAQAKLSARVVSVMPFVLIAVFSLVSDGFLTPFFSSPMGLALLGLALGMQAAGILVVRRMLTVEVDR